MKKILLTISLFLIAIVTSYAQQNLGVNQSNPTAKIHITNTENQNSLQVDDEDGDASPFVIDSLGNAQVGGKLTTDSLMIPTNASDGAVLTSDGNGNGTWETKEMAIYQDKKPDGTLGGSSVAGWQIRELNFTVFEEGTSITRSGNVITLQPGTYQIVASAPSFETNHHQLVIRDNGTNNILIEGTSGYSSLSSGGYTQTLSLIDGVLVITSATDIILSHYTGNIELNNGLGTSVANGADDIFSVIRIEKIK